MKFVDILLNLSNLEKLFLSTYNLSKERELANDFDIDLGTRSSGWPMFPDILINPNTREFVGLTYYVLEKYRTHAQQFDRHLNRVRYLKGMDFAELPYYAQQEHSDYLEVTHILQFISE